MNKVCSVKTKTKKGEKVAFLCHNLKSLFDSNTTCSNCGSAVVLIIPR